MKFEVVGNGCRKCMELEKRVKEAVSALGIEAEVEHVYDISRLADMGVVSTPALIMDGKPILSGMLPTVEYLVNLIRSKAA
ncbi:MAG: thioredoxin family protein [Candidatus Micrarchaeota archaeon]